MIMASSFWVVVPPCGLIGRTMLFAALLSLSIVAIPPASAAPPQTEWVALDGSNMMDLVFRRAMMARIKRHPELGLTEGVRDADVVKVSDQGYVMRLGAISQPRALWIHFQLCPVQGQDRVWIGDAVFFGPSESAREFLTANAETEMFPGADYALCQPPGFQLTKVGDQSKSSTRALLHLGGLIRYFLLYKPDSLRGADLLRVSASSWRGTLRERDESKDLRFINLSLQLVDSCFPFDVLGEVRVDGPTRDAVRELLEATLYLRRKLRPFDPSTEGLIRRDEKLLARVSSH